MFNHTSIIGQRSLPKPIHRITMQYINHVEVFFIDYLLFVQFLRGHDTDSFQGVLYRQLFQNFKHYEHLLFLKYLNTYYR